MRQLIVCASLFLLAGCGVTSASSSTPTPRPKVASHRIMTFSQPPAMTVKSSKRYVATISTTDGTFTVELLPRLAPMTVNNFVFLARHGFYNNVQFLRIIRDFMVQTGDPTATGEGGPGYEFNDEIHPKYHLHYYPGVVAMANHGPNTNGSQFFIVTGPSGLSLKYSYTIFGFVSHGMNVVQRIARTPVGQNITTGELSQPLLKVYMRKVTIRVLPPLRKGAVKLPTR